jgi:hypothetical protein
MRKGEIHAKKNTHSNPLPRHTLPLDDRVEPLLHWKQPDNRQAKPLERTHQNPNQH